MKRLSKILCLILVLCIISSITLFFAYADNEKKEETTQTEETKAETKTVAKAEVTAKVHDEKKASANELYKLTAEWDVMIYLCGTDLESAGGMATTNLEMIKSTIPDDKVNVLIQTGGTKKWDTKERIGIDIATDKLQRWSYGDEGFVLKDELDNASMAKYTTLSDFITWGAENYPAKKHLLIIWDHGGGSSSGLIVDELHDKSIMSLEGLERALKDAGLHFDLVMTDACLMASLETAQAIQSYADYLIASEEVLPGYGSNYAEWLQSLYDEPECEAPRLGSNICNATQIMYAEMADDGSLKGLTFSTIDLKKIAPVAEAFEAYMKEVIALIPDPVAFGQYLSAVSKTDRYKDRDMWDLYDLARRGRNGGISKETVLKLENAVDDAVVTCVRGSYHPYSHGLSAFITYNGTTDKLDRFARTCKNPWQMAFLDAVSLKWDAPEWACEISGEIPQLKPELYTVKFETENSEDNSQQLIHIYSGVDSGGSICYEIQSFDEQYQEWHDLGQSEDLKFLGYTDNILTYTADFTGKWPAIDDKFLHVATKDIQGNTVLMQATVRVPEINSERLMKLRILAEYPEGLTNTIEDEPEADTLEEHIVRYQLAGIWDGYDSSSGLSDRNAYSMADLLGAQMEICTPIYSDYLKKIGDMRYNDPVTIDYSLDVQDTVLPKGKYRMRYTITDMLDRTYNTEFVNFTWDGSKAVFEAPAEPEDDSDTKKTIIRKS
ncbi:clostripain-related cysteine peptidase [Oribacterium sp. WCC10]|uniref:clostripain-related cysteine peptidase n=1 Tax=Oribacterium sp. WCC10 TaxID=1855343 RepID=UPI0008E7DC1A|nr:clostripain-related cysteine peptidase [Oribacterium sp. WCC10]SFG19920.1 hypothetical protein SAMN05216356_10397 [Oribacterium sp. WCC10]